MLLFLLYFDQINTAMENIRDFFQKHKQNIIIPNFWPVLYIQTETKMWDFSEHSSLKSFINVSLCINSVIIITPLTKMM